MSGKVAIITGAGRGIGRATAIELARRGYLLTLVSRNQSELDQTARLAGNGLAILGDVSRLADIRQIVNQTLEQFGRVDVVVNNAGHAPMKSMEQMTPEDWQAILDTNLSSAFYMCQAVWPVFIRVGGGVVVNISSMASRDPFDGLWAYGAAKAGVNLMGLGLAREGAAHHIRVHTIAPGAVETSMLRTILTKDQLPSEKAMEPADVARVVGQCVDGDLIFTSGEVVWLHKTV